MPQPALKIGDLVRILTVPPSVDREMPDETRHIFRGTVGKILRVDGINEHGYLELNVQSDGSQAPDYTHHTIWIEPEFVKLADIQ